MSNQTKNLSSEIWKKVSDVHSKIEKQQMKKTAQYKLTLPQFSVMEVLFNVDSMPLKKISNELNVTGANITCVVDNLEKRNLVVRVPSKTDRRIINAELTDKGKKMIEEIIPSYLNLLEDVTTNLTVDEKKEFIRLLEKLVA